MTDRRTHWDATYTAKDETAVSWFQPAPERSLDLIGRCAPARTAGILDVGGGASRLVDRLLAGGWSDVSVLDISAVALDKAKARLVAADAARVGWIVADATAWDPPRRWDLWHDRAVFHFLTETHAQDAYLERLRRALVPGGAVVMATFAPTGPEKCSGLPVRRYDAAGLAERLGADYELVAQASETHVTPWGSTQDFAYAAFRRRA